MMTEADKKIDLFYDSVINEMTEFKENGGIVAGLFERQFPLSVLAGFNVWPVRIISGANTTAESAGESIVRPDACPFCKSILGNFLNKSDIHKYIDFVIGVITCDQMRRTLERLQYQLNVPVFPVQLPSTRNEGTEEFYVQGVKEIIANLSAYLNQDIDENRILDDYNYRYENSKILKKMLLSYTVSPVLIHRLLIISAFARPEKFNSFLVSIISELPVINYAKRVVLIGNVLCREDEEIIEMLERNGVFPILLISSGLNEIDGYTSFNMGSNNPIEVLAKMSFNQPHEIRTRPNNSVYERIKWISAESEANGIICRTLSFCDLWNTEKQRMREAFSHLPLLLLDTGYGEGNKEQMKTRLEAFLEML